VVIYEFDGKEIPDDVLDPFLTYIGKFRNLGMDREDYSTLMVEILDEVSTVKSSRAKRSYLARKCKEFIRKHTSEKLSDGQQDASN